MIPPIVRQMVVCDDLSTDLSKSKRIDAFGLAHSITPTLGSQYPVKHPQLSVFLLLTGGVGSGRIQIRIRSEESDTINAASEVHEIENPVARNEVAGVIVRIKNCVFDKPGFYWVEFVYDCTFRNILYSKPRD